MSRSTKRTPNFSESEKQLLIKICNKHKNTIESKKTDAVTWKEKEAAWNKICKQFNSVIDGSARTEKQLQEKYKCIKKTLRKNYSNHRTYTRGTGGGPYVPPPTATTEDEKELFETIKLSIEGLQNQYDSDGLAGIKAIAPEAVRQEIESEDLDGMIEVDWTSASCSLWQTPKDPRLLLKKETDEIIHTDSNLYILEEDQDNSEQSSSAEKTTGDFSGDRDEDESQLLNSGISVGAPRTVSTLQNPDIGVKVTATENREPSKKWSSRRRPILQKKKTVSSAGAKFELVAEKKMQLIDYQKMVAENQIEQNKKEHDLRMEILEIKNTERNGVIKISTSDDSNNDY